MNKTELASKLAGKTDLSQAKAEEVVDCIFSSQAGHGILAVELDADREISIAGFGKVQCSLLRAGRTRTRRLDAQDVEFFILHQPLCGERLRFRVFEIPIAASGYRPGELHFLRCRRASSDARRYQQQYKHSFCLPHVLPSRGSGRNLLITPRFGVWPDSIGASQAKPDIQQNR